MVITTKECEKTQCNNCLYTSNHAFGISFNAEGLCSGCSAHLIKETINWEKRFSELLGKVEQIKHLNRNNSYDCVIPVRGTPEYFYVLDLAINQLNLKPLAVQYNSQFSSKVGVMNIALMREVFDVDMLVYYTNPVVYKKMIRESMLRLNNMRWPYLAGETAFPMQVALEKEIPMIILPYHQPTEQVGLTSYSSPHLMTMKDIITYDLVRTKPEDFTKPESLIIESDIADIILPEDCVLENGKITGIYLGSYMPWDPPAHSEAMVAKYGAFCSDNLRTFDTYERIDDTTYMSIHDIFKYALHGYTRVTDNLCRDIRFGRVSREDALILEKYYQSIYPEKSISVFLKWLGMNEKALNWILERTPYGKYEQNDDIKLTTNQKSYCDSYRKNAPPVHGDNQFILCGKGLSIS